MCFYHFALAADDLLGRVDIHSLSQQTIMEIFADGLAEKLKKILQDEHGSYHDVCNWRIVTCNDDNVITNIKLLGCAGGRAAFSYIPTTVTSFQASYSALEGSLETHGLPNNLEILRAQQNTLTGTVDMCQLPAALRIMNIAFNFFCGECDLTSLPEHLEELYVQQNQLSGSVVLDKLPVSLSHLDLEVNQFSGELCFDNLPRAMVSICLGSNGFCGEFKILDVPETLTEITANKNNFEGVATVYRKYAKTLMLRGNNCTKVIDENGELHPHEDRILNGGWLPLVG